MKLRASFFHPFFYSQKITRNFTFFDRKTSFNFLLHFCTHQSWFRGRNLSPIFLRMLLYNPNLTRDRARESRVVCPSCKGPNSAKWARKTLVWENSNCPMVSNIWYILSTLFLALYSERICQFYLSLEWWLNFLSPISVSLKFNFSIILKNNFQ